MSTITVVPATTPVHVDVDVGHPRPKLWHVPSKADPTKALCGTPNLVGEGSVAVPDGSPESCVVCDEMNAWGAR
jgi:hypothetical protein